MARAGWRLTVRSGSDVDKLHFDSAADAIAAVREWIDRVRSEGGLPPISGFRDYRPGERVHARIEVKGPGLLRPAAGGVDVMGDGGVVVYSGAVSRQVLGGDTVDEALGRLRDALSS